VLVSLEGGDMGIETVRRLLREDGEDMNMSWDLLDSPEDVLPVEWLNQLSERTKYSGKVVKIASERARFLDSRPKEDGKVESASRFVLSFKAASQARRFVRYWHRRSARCPDTGREQVINAATLW
jgi:hypothetical protein